MGLEKESSSEVITAEKTINVEAGTLPPLMAATLGGLLTTWVTFTPCFLWIFLGAPFIERLRNNQNLPAALSAITAAVVGVILNLAVWFGLHVVFAEVKPLDAPGLDLLIPVLSSVNLAAAALTVIALLAVLWRGMGTIQVLLLCGRFDSLSHLVPCFSFCF